MAIALLLMAVLAGCGSDPVGAPGAPTGRAWVTPPADTTDGGLVGQRLPRVEYQGGPFLRNPRIVTVTFTDDDAGLVDRLERFGDTITRTSWWRDVVDSYCVTPEDCIGQGTPGPHVHLEEPLPAQVHDVEIAMLVTSQAQAGRFDVLDRNTLLLVYLPANVALSEATAGTYCDGGPRALHRALRLPAAIVPYAVIPRCGTEADLTATASHEIVEATTNPDPSRRGFSFTRSSESLGFTYSGVEPVDPCGLITMNANRTVQDGFTLQRAWSNRAAAAGHNPCVPAPDRPYLALIPAAPTVQLTPGTTITIPLTATADRPVPAWTVTAFDLAEHHGRQRCVAATLDRSTVATGQTAHLTITARQPNPEGPCIVALLSTASTGSYLWPLAVSVTG